MEPLTIIELKNAFTNNTPIIFTKHYDEYMIKKSGLVRKIEELENDYIIYIEIEPKVFYKLIYSSTQFYLLSC